MNNLQMVLAILIPTVTVLTGIIVSNGRFNSIETRLTHIEAEIGDIRERLARLERV